MYADAGLMNVQDPYLTEDGAHLKIPINIEETMAVLTRCSFDDSHRQPISFLGGIPALAELIQVLNQFLTVVFSTILAYSYNSDIHIHLWLLLSQMPRCQFIFYLANR
jgi:hypothetical protein